MKNEIHFRRLERMYLEAPINGIFNPRIKISSKRAEIEMKIKESFFHGAGALHGCIYFKMMDDAGFFASNSVVHDYLVLTLSFTTYFIRPVKSGIIRSVGRVVAISRTQIISEAYLVDHRGKEIGKGSGIFVKSRILLADLPGYKDYT